MKYAETFSYAYSKYVGQRLLEIISARLNRDIRVLMISDVYGPGQAIDKDILTSEGGLRRPQVFLAAYRAITENHQEWIPQEGRRPAHGFSLNPSTGTITQKVWQDYVAPTFVEDVVKMILRASTVDRAGLPAGKVLFNVGAPAIANADFSRNLARQLNASLEVEPSGDELFPRPMGQDADLDLLGIKLTPLEQGVRQWIAYESDDHAIFGNNSKKVGGIDMNPAMIKTQTRKNGKGVIIPIAPASAGNFKVDGFSPVIINIAPAVNLPLLLGIAQPDPGQEKPKDVSALFNPYPMDSKRESEDEKEKGYLSLKIKMNE